MKKTFDFIAKRKIFLLISVGLILAGLIVNLFLGTELDINFKGGAIFTYSLTGDVDEDGIAAIAKEHLGEDVEVDFSADIAGESMQATFTLVEIPSTVLTYEVTGTPKVETISKTGEEVFECQTKVEYDETTKLLTVDPAEIVTDAMVDDFTAALKSDEKDAPTFTLISSNTVSELADAIYNDMVGNYGSKLVYAVKADSVDIEAVTGAVEDALITGVAAAAQDASLAEVTLTFDKTAKTLTVTPVMGNQPFDEAYTKVITEALQKELPKAGIALNSETYNTITLITSNSVKATVGKGFFIKCLFAMVLGGLFLTLYIGVRFRKIGGLSAGLFATFSLIHDVLIAYLVYVVFRIPLDDNFIAVVLTILGYSINGTIVIYDRIRENEQKFGGQLTVNEIVNRSVNETVNRNIFTSLTTLIAVVSIAVVAMINGLNSIISFAFPMAVGILAGFYSSVLLSSPLWAWWRTRKLEKAKA